MCSLIIVDLCARVADKNLSVSISGDVDEAKALSRPPEDSQGKCGLVNMLFCKTFSKMVSSSLMSVSD